MVRDEASILRKIQSMATAVVFGTYVTEEVKAARVAICKSCNYYEAGVCGICGCNTGGIKASVLRQITELSSYEEQLPRYGCKHPDRESGKGWPLTVLPTPEAVPNPIPETAIPASGDPTSETKEVL